MLSTRDLRPRDTYRQKMRGWKNIFHAMEILKVGVAIIISDKVDFKGHYKRKGNTHYIMIKGL